VRVAQAEVESTIRPVVLDAAPEPRGPEIDVHFGAVGLDMYASARRGVIATRAEEGFTLIGFPIRNVGPGAAVLTTPHPSCKVGPKEAATQGAVDRLAIPPGSNAYAVFRLTGGPPGQLYIEVAYTDVGGGQFTRTQLYAAERPPEGMRVRGAALFRGHSASCHSSSTARAGTGLRSFPLTAHAATASGSGSAAFLD
jgi:hypothetical protein